MEIIKFIYLNQEVEFEIGKTNVIVNATEMAKIFGKQVNEFVSNENTQKFINACLKHCKNKTPNSVIEQSELDLNNGNSRYINTESFTSNTENSRFISNYLDIESKEGLIISKTKTGTWMHRVLALKFAAWLDSDFEVWIYATIDILINKYFKEQKEALVERLTAKQLKEAKRLELLETYPEIKGITEYFDLEDTEKKAHKRRMKSIRSQIKQLKLEFHF